MKRTLVYLAVLAVIEQSKRNARAPVTLFGRVPDDSATPISYRFRWSA